MQTSTSRTNMNVRRSRFTGDRARERVVGDFACLEIAAQPDSFGSVGAHSHIDAAAMIKTQRAMQTGLSFGADRKRMIELLRESQGQRLQIFGFPEQTVAFVMFHAGGEGIGKC